MSWRIVVINSRARLETKMGYLVVRGTETTRILIDEISVLLIEDIGCIVSSALLETLLEHKVNVLLCNHKHNPAMQVLPLHGSYDTSAKIYSQIKWSDEIKGLVWAEIVRDKIRKQSGVLRRHIEDDSWKNVLHYASEVEIRDASNREAHAAKVYFNALLGHSFSRHEPSYVNDALNYGYAILLSVVSRCIVSNGYLTQLGIFHHSVFNSFNLSSDLMEPFRPLVDEKVLSLPIGEELSHESKMIIINLLNDIVMIKGKKTTVVAALEIYVKSVLDSLESGNSQMISFYETET